MNRTAPRIGYSQFIHLEWIVKALEIRAGLAHPESLDVLLARTCSARTAGTGSTTILNRMWLNPPENLRHLTDWATGIFRSNPDVPPAAFAWGMALAAYPFFTEAAIITGRLSAIYNDFAPATVHRRMAENYGESDFIRNAVNMTFRSQVNWGLLEYEPDSKILTQSKPLPLNNPDLLQWIVSAILSATDRPLALDSLEQHPLLRSFELHEHFRFILLNAPGMNIYPDFNGINIYPDFIKTASASPGKTEKQQNPEKTPEFSVEQESEPEIQGPEF